MASIWLGVVHVLIGWDHVAFLLLLLLWVSTLSDRVVAISAFTIGHSVTLGAVAFGFAPWSSGATELLIAVSVLLLASETWIGQGRATPTKTRLALLVGGVGLIHGLGFGGVLLELGSTRGGAVKTLFGFNIGIELGQLALFSVWTVLEISVGRGAERGWAAFRRTVNLTAGILGAFWTIDRTMGWLQELL